MKDSGFKPKTDVQEYLFDKFNLDLYDDITKNRSDDPFFDPLSFFNLLYECLEFVKANKNKPIDVANHLERRYFQRSISKRKYHAHLFLLFNLNHLVEIHSGYSSDYREFDYPNDNELRTCNIFLNRLHSRLCFEDYPFKREQRPPTEQELADLEKEFEWDFWGDLQLIDAINDPIEKIKHLIDKKTEYLITFHDVGPNPEFPFQCDIEITRLKEIMKLQTSRKKQTIDRHSKLKDIFRDKEEYENIMKLLVKLNYCQKGNYLWQDRKKGNKGIAVALIKYLDARKYFIENMSLTNEAIIHIIKNTFGLDVGIDTAKTNHSDSFDWEKELKSVFPV